MKFLPGDLIGFKDRSSTFGIIYSVEYFDENDTDLVRIRILTLEGKLGIVYAHWPIEILSKVK